MAIKNGKINLTATCNMDCHCSGFSYTPVCREETGDTFFNPCVASCHAYDKAKRVGHQLLIQCHCRSNKNSLLFSSIMNVNVHEIIQQQFYNHQKRSCQLYNLR